MCLHDYFDQRKLAQRELHLYCYCCSILILTAWTKFMKISQQRCSRRIKYTTHMASRPSFPQLLKCVTCIFITPNYYILSYMSSYHFCNNLLKQVETGMSKLQEETHLFYLINIIFINCSCCKHGLDEKLKTNMKMNFQYWYRLRSRHMGWKDSGLFLT